MCAGERRFRSQLYAITRMHRVECWECGEFDAVSLRREDAFIVRDVGSLQHQEIICPEDWFPSMLGGRRFHLETRTVACH